MGKEDMQTIEQKVQQGCNAEKKAAKAARRKERKAKRAGFWKDFKKFIMKGNVVDLAVAVILGAAFNAIVNGLVKLIINPLIAVFTGGISLDGIKTVIVPAAEAVLDAEGNVVTPAVEEIAILWGQWLQTILDFFIIAMTIFLIARIARRAMEIVKHKELEAAAAKAAEEAAKAEAKAAEAAAELERREQQLQDFYANVARQTALLEELAKKK